MARQMSLFPGISESQLPQSRDNQTENWPVDLPPIDEVLAATGRFQTGLQLGRLFDFIIRFGCYSAFNGFLLYLQNPAATRVATARAWSRKYNRTLKPDARPLIILAPMKPVIFVFDVADTIGKSLPDKGHELIVKPSRLEKLYQNSIHNCALQAIAVREVDTQQPGAESASRITSVLRRSHAELQLEKDKRYLVLLDKSRRLEDQYAVLARELGHIFCGHLGIDRLAWWPERKGLTLEGEELEAACVASLVCRRLGLQINPCRLLLDDLHSNSPMPDFSLHAVLQATTYIEEMARQRWRKPQKRGRR